MGCVGSLLAIFCSMGICSHLKWRLQSNPEEEKERKASDPEGQIPGTQSGSTVFFSWFNPLWNPCHGVLI